MTTSLPSAMRQNYPPVVSTETWMNRTPPGTFLFYCSLAMAFVFLACFPFHWAWNRRADRLNLEASLPQPALAAASGVWPPPPNVPEQQ